LQVKLLRLLESGTFRRVGGVETLRADFRLVAATHRNLEEMVDAETFRRDLYYRISAFPIPLPALRERGEDIPLLAQVMLNRLAPGRPLRLTESAVARLMQYSYPGNVRELRNILERAILLADGDTIDQRYLPRPQTSGRNALSRPVAPEEEILPLEEIERRYVQQTLRQLGGDKRELARRLGISERTLYRKL
jgi:DNA-binding NtrC family response regulator